MLAELKKRLNKLANKKKAILYQRYFKTGKGEYGHGDIFIGANIPSIRKVAGEFTFLPLRDIEELLGSDIHEERACSLIILVNRYKKGDEDEKKKIVKLYLKNTSKINNWDLVDLSAPYIIGDFFLKKDKSPLYSMAFSRNLWERRISIISTAFFIKNNDFKDTIRISEILLKDKHDLIHKATGWMLREMGKKDIIALKLFLDKHHSIMPRTMLRYAIEKLPSKERKNYLKK